VGKLYPNEVCFLDWYQEYEDMWCDITFRSSRGTVEKGRLYVPAGHGKYFQGLGSVAPMEEVYVNGVRKGNFRILKTRRNASCLYANGREAFVLPPNYYVAIDRDTIAGGGTNTVLVRFIHKVGEKWHTCTSEGNGFLALGLENGSSLSSINMNPYWKQ
jgi:hypothetical protein